MKVAVITDQHFGARKNSKLFHDYFLKFYNDVFFPVLYSEGITTVVDMGDTFDSRKGIDFSSLSWAKNNYYDKLKDMGITVHTIVGNHTAYYKNTNEINAVDLLLREYDNVHVYSEPTEIKLDELGVLVVPWINSENEERTYKALNKSDSRVVMGHLEFNGFQINQKITMDHGYDSKVFERFERVFSGHYHTRSNNDTIFYLGNPYELYWTDFNDTRGFHLLDTNTLEHTPINNPYRMFYTIYYEDTPYQTFDTRQYENKIVKLIVRKKSDLSSFEQFIDKLYASNVAELKIVENFDFGGWYEEDKAEALESEDTLSILDRYIDEFDINLNKSKVQSIIIEIYQEACELV